MLINSIPWWLWVVFALLLVAAEKMPYGYYTLARIVVCGFAFFLAFVGSEDSVASRVWSEIFCCIAVLFNPIFPIYLSGKIWYDFDVAVAIILAAHLALVRLGWLRSKG
jgi:hypothetical protein